MRYPSPLVKGNIIGVTGPSGGVRAEFASRLDLAEKHLTDLGFRIQEGRCLRSEVKHVSAEKHLRAKDFMSLWESREVSAIIPPWGGELLIELLPLFDFEKFRAAPPKWILGYSDTSTLLFPLTILGDMATAHGTNLMDNIPGQTDDLTRACIDVMGTKSGSFIEQHSSSRYQKQWPDISKEPARGFDLTEDTRWKVLGKNPLARVTLKGRIIGGCLDTLTCLVGTKYGDLPSFKARHKSDGVILYLENCALAPCAVARHLWQMRLASWFDGLTGLVFGRSSGPDANQPEHLSYVEALESVLGDLDIPVVYDADIGHVPPQMTLINGSLAEVTCENGRGSIKQNFV